MARMQVPIVHTTISRDGQDLEVIVLDDTVIAFGLVKGVRVGDHQFTDAPHDVASRLERLLEASPA